MIATTGEVLGTKRYSEHYHSLTLVSPDIGEEIAPGQFVNIRCGRGSSHILRRPFSVYRVHKRGGWASTIEIVFDIRGAGTRYLSELRPHLLVDLVGPLGRGFAMPKRRAHCLLVGGGVGAAPLFFLADELRNEDHRVDVVLGARSSRLLLNPIEVRRLASVSRIVTEDGSTGDKGRVTDVLEETIARCNTDIIYTCGPHPMLAAVSAMAVEHQLPVQVAVEELMACGFGVCMTCVMPVKVRRRGAGNGSRDNNANDEIVYARSCTEGPVFNGASVVWDGGAAALDRDSSSVETESVAADQAELSPAGVPRRQTSAHGTLGENPPPGN